MPTPLENALAEMGYLPPETVVGPGLTTIGELRHMMAARRRLPRLLAAMHFRRMPRQGEEAWLAAERALREGR